MNKANRLAEQRYLVSKEPLTEIHPFGGGDTYHHQDDMGDIEAYEDRVSQANHDLETSAPKSIDMASTVTIFNAGYEAMVTFIKAATPKDEDLPMILKQFNRGAQAAIEEYSNPSTTSSGEY